MINIDVNFSKVKSKKELEELLESYKNVLNNSMIDYLNSLINLEISAIYQIDSNMRDILRVFKIYEEATKYNITKRTISLLRKNFDINVSDNKNTNQILSIFSKQDQRTIDLFKLHYIKDKFSSSKDLFIEQTVPNLTRIDLYQFLEDEKVINYQKEQVSQQLQALLKEKNPYPMKRGRISDISKAWMIRHKQEIARYKDELDKLTTIKDLSDLDQKTIILTKDINDLLLEDIDITDDRFDHVITSGFFQSPTKLTKTLVKKQPGLDVYKHINYI